MHAVKYEPHGGWHVVLALCSDVRQCAAACIVAGGASDVHVRACVRAGCVGHTVRWPVVALRLAGQERSPERCIVAAFAVHQWTSAVLDGGGNPKPSPSPRIFSRIRPKPSAYQILRTVTTLMVVHRLTLNHLHYSHYCKLLLDHQFQAERLPPSQGAAHYHVLRVHLQVIE